MICQPSHKALHRILVYLAFTVCVCLSNSANAQWFTTKQPQLLSEHEAFQLFVYQEGKSVIAEWVVAEDYYLYRDKFSLEIDGRKWQFQDLKLRQGRVEDDPEFGRVEVYFNNAKLTAEVSEKQLGEQVKIVAYAQGCNKPVGVCYPPMTRELTLEPTELALTEIAQPNSELKLQPPQSIKPKPSDLSLWTFIVSAFAAGLLLSFSPCVLPMIPILAGIISGQQQNKWRSGSLAIAYVLGTVISYAAMGAVAGATGAQLQAYFQNIWAVSVIVIILLLLAASLFGIFRMEMPAFVQTRLASIGASSSYSSVVLLGAASALIVGTCVSPILITTLGVAISQGSALLGASSMAAMALGMGMILIAFGFGAGWLLPKAGPWMNLVQHAFGFMLIGVAIYLLSGVNATLPSLALWGVWLISIGVYCFYTKYADSGLLRPTVKTIGGIACLWGAMCLVGQASGGVSVTAPLENVIKSPYQSQQSVAFTTVKTLPQMERSLQQALDRGQNVLVDYYADWCIECIRALRTTFKDQRVIDGLANWTTLKVDVTTNNQDAIDVKQFFSVFGPPATLFINNDGAEISSLRRYGYLNSATMLDLIKRTEENND